MQPVTEYAKSGDVNIAYQVVGDGPIDVLLVPGWVSHVELVWEVPTYARFLKRIASFSRLIILDRRGTGLSDPVDRLPTLEERMDDVNAVMDAARSERAVLFGISEGGPMCILFAATYPKKVSSLVLFGTFARYQYSPDYPIGRDPATSQEFLDYVESRWGQGISAKLFAPSMARDETFLRAWGRLERTGLSPGRVKQMLQILLESDVRHVLPSITVPTLVLGRSGDRVTPVEWVRYISAHIPGSKLVELTGEDHFPWVDPDPLLDEVEEFLTGTRHTPDFDRVLTTVLFTDVVGATKRAAEIGDRKWRELLEQHHTLVRREVERYRGKEIDNAGDGFFVTFDGPGRAIACACAIRDSLAQLGLAIRAGLHTGECELIGDKVGGIAVHIGARIEAIAEAGQILVSGTVKDLVVGSDLAFVDHGVKELKGIPGEWHIHGVESA